MSTDDPRRPNVDYAVREVDFYYGVRGPALSSQPTRKLKTGPADPVGPASAASGWFRGMFGRKNKEAGKGFEVVRSTRATPHADEEGHPQSYPSEQYHDSPQMQGEGYLPGQQTRSLRDDIEDENELTNVISKGARSTADEIPSPLEEEAGDISGLHRYPSAVSDISQRYVNGAPTLGPIDAGGNIELPSRFNSRRSGVPSRAPSAVAGPSSAWAQRATPSIPRKSSRRQSSADMGTNMTPRLATVDDTFERSSGPDPSSYPRLPFTTASPDGHHRNRLSMGAQSLGAESFDDSTIVGGPGFPGRSQGYHQSNPSNTGSLMPPSIHERPTSVGYVNQYRASDSIQHFDAQAHSGYSSVEYVDNEGAFSTPRRGNESFDRQR